MQKTSKINLSDSAQFLKGVGPRLADLLTKKGINTVEDVLYFLPRQYEDRRQIFNVANAPVGARASVIGDVLSSGFAFRGRRRVFEVLIGDHLRQLQVTWFQGNFVYLAKNFARGTRVVFSGEVRAFGRLKTMTHPDFEIIDEADDVEGAKNFRGIIPIYPTTEGLTIKTLRRIIGGALEKYAELLLDELPPSIMIKHGMMALSNAARYVHFPPDDADINALNEARSEYHRRIIYDEFFFLQLGIALRRSAQAVERGIAFSISRALLEKFFESLPFDPTNAQRRVISEIAKDMQKASTMNRLLQGDVGSGKTLVAFAAMLIACADGYQAALMAPTELLAQQHHATLEKWAGALGIGKVLLTGSLIAAQKREAFAAIQNGEARIIIGTHALLYDQAVFANLGLVVIDEQHRFGVAQRAMIRGKGVNPDVLVMTATPIPRTLAMSVYGDLDVSVIDEMAPHKKPIKTKLFFESQRATVYKIVAAEVGKGNQAFIVYPLIEESDALGLKDASRMAEHLRRDVFPRFVVGLVHGRMKSKERDEEMKKFQRGEINILVATTIVEVGIDVPEASVMVIENAERFGLSQLHQLRGRVGRGRAQSYCLLLAQHTGSDDARRRLRIMEETDDGFRIAEEDLAIRGPGEFLGTRQSGFPDFRAGNIVRDALILSQAREDALALIENDRGLEHHENRHLLSVLQKRWQGRLGFAKVG